MKIFFSEIKYSLFILFFFISYKLNAEEYTLKNISNEESQIIVESNTQRYDLKNSLFYVEGDVLITNDDQEFFAKSNKAIIHRLTGKIELTGNVEVKIMASDLYNVNAAEAIFYLKEKTFEAISDKNERVKTTFVFK